MALLAPWRITFRAPASSAPPRYLTKRLEHRDNSLFTTDRGPILAASVDTEILCLRTRGRGVRSVGAFLSENMALLAPWRITFRAPASSAPPRYLTKKLKHRDSSLLTIGHGHILAALGPGTAPASVPAPVPVPVPVGTRVRGTNTRHEKSVNNSSPFTRTYQSSKETSAGQCMLAAKAAPSYSGSGSAA